MWKSQQHQHHHHQHQRRHVGCSAKTRAGVNTGAHWSNAPLVFFLPDETHSRTAGRGVYQPVSRRCRQRAIRVARGDGEKAREYSCLGPPPTPTATFPLIFLSDSSFSILTSVKSYHGRSGILRTRRSLKRYRCVFSFATPSFSSFFPYPTFII